MEATRGGIRSVDRTNFRAGQNPALHFRSPAVIIAEPKKFGGVSNRHRRFLFKADSHNGDVGQKIKSLFKKNSLPFTGGEIPRVIAAPGGPRKPGWFLVKDR